MAIPAVLENLKDCHPGVDTVLLCGVEAHVCVQATAIDFLQMGFNVSTGCLVAV